MIFKKIYRLLSLLITLSIYCNGYTQSPDAISFIANKGQWDAMYQYQAAIPGGGMWVTKDGFMYCYTSEADMEAIESKWEQGLNVDSEKVHGHWYKVNFKGHNEHISYSGSAQRSWYYNLFHGNDSSRWRGHVPLYGSVRMSGVYDNIDAVLYTKDRGLKYDWIVHPGSDPNHIRMQYEGVNPVIDSNGNLRITTSVNEVTEARPYAYQLINGDTIAVPCHYALNNDIVSFVLPEGYDITKDLIIDPQLIFVTYSGAGPFSAGYFSFCSTYDKNGNFYAAGVPLRGNMDA